MASCASGLFAAWQSSVSTVAAEITGLQSVRQPSIEIPAGRSAPDAKHSQRPMSAPPAGASSARIAPPLDTSRAVREGAGPLDLLEGSTLLAQSGTGREEPVEGEARHLADAVLPADDDNATLRAPPPLRDGCAANCLNRLSFIHCDPRLCPYGDRCSNRCGLGSVLL